MLRLGVTTVECKSGYGLSLDDELKLLRVYRRLQLEFAGTLVSTFLGAHVVPPEFRDDRAGYVNLVCEQMIPAVAAEKLAAFCDVFVEKGAFSVEEARTIFDCAKRWNLRPKLHADQLADGGGAKLAAEVGAISADHLEFASDEGLKAMAHSGVTAVLLPFASLYLCQPPLDARRCIAAGVPVAVATDFNPGSAPSYHLAARHDAGVYDEPSDAGARAQGGDDHGGQGDRRGKRSRFSRTRQASPISCCSTPNRSSIGCITSGPTRSARSMSAETAFFPLPALWERGWG